MAHRAGRGGVLALGLLLGCENAPSFSLSQSTGRLIYGNDDRLDWYALDDDRLRKLALESAVAQLPRWALVPVEGGAFTVSSPSLGELAQLCPTEAFATQPAAASCSGVLVADSLVLTAGHCVSSKATCDEQAWVFGYALTDPTASPLLEPDDIYGCQSIVARARYTDSAGRRWDHALVELDRPVVAPRRPVELVVKPLENGSPLLVIGFPSGLPVKVDAHAEVTDARTDSRDYFELISDASQGSSGAGVFDREGRLAGILVRGGIDFEYRPELDCFVSRRIANVEDLDRAEQASYAASALNCACRSGWEGGEVCARSLASSAESKAFCSERSEAASPAESSNSGSCALASRSQSGSLLCSVVCLLALIRRRAGARVRRWVAKIFPKVGGSRSSNWSKSARLKRGECFASRLGVSRKLPCEGGIRS
jgi:V8-like Glu-specific endopeptidase